MASSKTKPLHFFALVAEMGPAGVPPIAFAPYEPGAVLTAQAYNAAIAALRREQHAFNDNINASIARLERDRDQALASDMAPVLYSFCDLARAAETSKQAIAKRLLRHFGTDKAARVSQINGQSYVSAETARVILSPQAFKVLLPGKLARAMASEASSLAASGGLALPINPIPSGVDELGG